jgi:hypothetical protein
MNNHRFIMLCCCAALIVSCRTDIATIKRDCTVINRRPVITPDYAGITLPPNIAPLRFSLKDSCTVCFAEIVSVNGPSITVWSKNGTIRIHPGPWKRLLSQNAGKQLRITIYARGNHGKWHRYTPFENSIASESVDRYCTYRLIGFQYNYSRDIRECQRDLTSFNETVMINTQNYKLDCVNCHTPLNNDPGHFVLQSRSANYGSKTLIACGDTITTLSSRLGHAAWHPDGSLIAFSVYNVQQYFHAVGRQFIDVYDNHSCIVIYDAANRKIVPLPQLNQPNTLETWPAWSPDGRYLYFCSAPVLWSDYRKEPPDNFNRTKYSLLRIAYDPVNKRWGAVDTVLSAGGTGRSIVQPKLSPDNRFCLFCMQDYGAYPHTQVSSDLYLMDLATRQFRKLPVNSAYNESWHSWSKNSRWILFSSKRGGGIFTRLYLSHIDSAGNAGKPFLLPQRDPTFYDSFIKCYNVPEFAVAPVRFSERRLLKAIGTTRTVSVPVPSSAEGLSTGTSFNGWSTDGNRE